MDSIKNLITETLTELDLYSDDARDLLLGTCAQESAFGKYRKQLGGGPALGIFQMEPNTFNDIVNNYLKYKPELRQKVLEVASTNDFRAAELVNNDKLACAMARVHYLRVPKAIPHGLEEQAAYYKQYYNTPLGAATVDEYIKNYHKYVE